MCCVLEAQWWTRQPGLWGSERWSHLRRPHSWVSSGSGCASSECELSPTTQQRWAGWLPSFLHFRHQQSLEAKWQTWDLLKGSGQAADFNPAFLVLVDMLLALGFANANAKKGGKTPQKHKKSHWFSIVSTYFKRSHCIPDFKNAFWVYATTYECPADSCNGGWGQTVSVSSA